MIKLSKRRLFGSLTTAVILPASLLGIYSRADAATRWWDLNGNTAGVGGAAGGTWNTTNTNWSIVAGGNTGINVWNSNDFAVFAGTPGVVTVNTAAPLNVLGLQFDVTGYTLTSSGGAAGTLTLSNNPTLSAAAGTTSTINAILANGTGTLNFTGTGTIQLNGAFGSIASTNYSVAGGGLVLNNTTAAGGNNNARLADTAAFSFNNSTFVLRGSDAAATDTAETIGNLTLTTGTTTLTADHGATNAATLNAGTLTHVAGGGSALVNGSGLGRDSASTTSVSRILLGAAPTLVGGSAATATGVNAGAQNTVIVPFLVGESSGGLGTDTGVANTFVTYHATTGLRPLDSSEFTTDAIAAGNNTRITSATTSAAGASINSLVIAGGDLSIDDGTTLTNTSGAVLFTTSNAILPSGSTGALGFGATEAILSVNAGVTGTIGAGITGSGPVNKVGGGTLSLSGNNAYTGTTYVNAGTLLVNGANALSTATGNSFVINPAGTLNLNGFSKTTTGTLAVAAGGQLVTGAGTLGVGTGTAVNTINGAVTGNLTVTGTANNNLTITSTGSINGTTTLAGLSGITATGNGGSIAGTLDLGTTAHNIVTTAATDFLLVSAQVTGGSGGKLTALGAGTTILTNGANSHSDGTFVGSGATAGNLESRANGTFGSGPITLASGGALLKFTTTNQTIANDIILAGTGAASPALGANPNLGNLGIAGFKVTLTGNLTGNDDNLRIAVPIASGAAQVVEIRPAAGKLVTGTGNMTVTTQGLSISQGNSLANPSQNQMLTGNLALGGGGAFIFDNLSYSDWGRTPGTGGNQWQITGAGGGFAARGQDVTITSAPTNILDSNIGIGFGDVTYADHAVKFDTGQTLTMSANRQIWAWGGGQTPPNQLNGFTFVGPINEIADRINSNGFALNVSGNANSGLNGATSINWANTIVGGVVRLSNPNNTIATLNIGQTGAGAVVITNTGAGGGGTINVGGSGSGVGGYLYFEDVTPGFTGTTFANNFNVNVVDLTGNRNVNGFGLIAGNATFTGTATLTTPSTLTAAGTVSASGVPINVLSGRLTLGDDTTPATLKNDRSLNYASPNFNGATYIKNNDGEIVLHNVSYAGSNPNGFKWRLVGGTLTSENPAYVTSGNLSMSDMLAMNASAGRKWKVAVMNHTFNNVASNSFFGSPTVDVASGVTLTTNLAGGQSLAAGTTGAQTLFKAGGGTWVFNSPVTTMSGGEAALDAWQVDAGTLDVRGNTGIGALRLSGGTLLVADVSGFAQSHATNNRFEIDADGGKLGVSVNATASVTRGATSPAINAWTQGGQVTFASRNDFSLIFANAAFPDITAGTVLFERDVVADATPTGFVQINDTAVSVGGASTRVGGSGLVRFGATGTGTWTFNDGTLAPGSSPGVLTVDGNVALTNAAEFEVEIDGVIVGSGYDRLVLSNNAARTIALGNAELIVDLGYAAAAGDIFTIIDNQRADNLGTTGLLNYGGNPLNEGDAFSAFFGGDEYGFTITYAGGTGNDVVLTSTGLIPIPEPASLALLGLGGAALLRRRR